MTSSDSIASRVSFRHAQECINCERATLLIPAGDNKKITPRNVTRKGWLEKITHYLQEGLDLGLFGESRIDRVVERAFNEANQGWCQGTADCLLVDRNPKLPITTIVKKIFHDKERLCFAQLCYLFEDFVQYALKGYRDLQHVCDAACHQKGAYRTSSYLPRPMVDKVIKEVVGLWKTNRFRRLEDKEFMVAKNEIIFRHFGKPRGRNGLLEKGIIVDDNKIYSLKALLDKVHHLREQVLGDALPVPTYIATRENPSGALRFMKYPRAIRLIQVWKKDHIYTFFTHRSSWYLLNTHSGLSVFSQGITISFFKDRAVEQYNFFTR